MRQRLSALGAQVEAETRSRLRSTGTIVTVIALFAVAFAYVPPPDAHRVSIMWHAGGHDYSGTYTAGFIGAIVAMLTGLLLPLVGFYLVAGSVRRDLERRIWPIIAATRTSATSYLLGKWLAGFAYLLVLAAVALVPAAFLFLRYGSGPFSLGQLVLPWLLIAPPAMAFTAALALFFDVTPGLRGRGGQVLAFFAWSILFVLVPGQLGGMVGREPGDRRGGEALVSYDPGGAVLFDRLVRRSASMPVESLSMGIIFTNTPIERVPFAPLRIDGEVVATRAASTLWTLAPLLAAIAIFHRTAARGAAPTRQRGRERAPPPAAAGWQAPANGAPSTPAVALAFQPHRGQPGLSRAVFAESLLIWQVASWLKWPLAAASLAVLAVPERALAVPIAVFLLALAPVIAETAAREELYGTGPTVFAQPGVPRSPVVWKGLALAGFVLTIGTPIFARSLLRGAEHGVAMLLGLVFVASVATGLSSLSRGGKLFLGLFTALWYLGVQTNSPLDWTGAFSTPPSLPLAAGFAAAGLAIAAAAAAVERARG